MMSLSKKDLRHCVFYDYKQWRKAKDAFDSLCKVFCDNLATYLTAIRRYERFKRPIPKRKIHTDKVMLCVWSDWKGILYCELLQPKQSWRNVIVNN